MFWLATGSLIIIFFGTRAYLNNAYRWRMRQFPQGFSRLLYLLLQAFNVLIIFAAVMFFMLAIVGFINGYQVHFSSDYSYAIQILPGKEP